MIKLKISPKVIKAMKEELVLKQLTYEKQLTYLLEAAVAELVNHAKLGAEYQDQTSNLKSSIGGIVLRNGIPVSYRGFEKEAPTGKKQYDAESGVKTGLEFATDVSKNLNTGYGIVIVAGMEYATYVEDVHGLNVLGKTGLKAYEELPKLLAQLKQRIG